MKRSIFIGWDPREWAAFAVACYTVRKHAPRDCEIRGLVLADLQERGLYRRPIEMRASAADGPIMWDVISDAPMSTQHANARFLTPYLAGDGWALFMDGDILVRSDLGPLFDSLDPRYAVYCVKHRHRPDTEAKMDGQIQTIYPRKNWTSFCIFNVRHQANKALTLHLINTAPGRELHAFCWLPDELIGELAPEWNWLVGYSDPAIYPKAAHFTAGIPDMPGYENVPFADEWRRRLNDLALGALSMPG